jgi:hypothetical protein
VGRTVDEAKSGAASESRVESSKRAGDSKSAAIWTASVCDGKRHWEEHTIERAKNVCECPRSAKKSMRSREQDVAKDVVVVFVDHFQFANFGERGKKKRTRLGRGDTPLYPSGLSRAFATRQQGTASDTP